MKRKALILICSFLFATLCAVVLWRPVCLQFQIHRATAGFRACYANPGNPKIIMNDIDWACEFAGSCGRNSLENFTKDQTITEEGRMKAENILQYIDSGYYRKYFQETRPSRQGILDSMYDNYVSAKNGG